MGFLEAAAFFVLLPAPARAGIIPADFLAHEGKGYYKRAFQDNFLGPFFTAIGFSCSKFDLGPS